MSQVSRVVQVITIAVLVLLPLNLLGSQADPAQTTYPGTLGDNINYRTGEITLSSTDVSLRGKRGLDVGIVRHYSSTTYDVADVDSAHMYTQYSSLNDSYLYRYLGEGWRIAFPYLTDGGDRQEIVYQDGSKEEFFANPDTQTNSDYRFKTKRLALLTNYGIDADTLADTMLHTNGSKWVFGFLKTVGGVNRKHLTKIINRFGDVLEVEYHTGTTYAWIKKVISPLGWHVTFQYKNDTGVVDTTYAPLGNPIIRLHKLWYLNHKGDPLSIEYQYDEELYRLKKVIFPNGQFEEYDYTNTVNHYPMADWDVDDNSALYYDADSTYSGALYFLSKVTGPAGAVAEFDYKSINVPVYRPCDGSRHCLNRVYSEVDTAWDFRNYVAVNRRSSEGDTLELAYQMVLRNLGNASNNRIPNAVGSKTTVKHGGGGEEELFFFYEAECVSCAAAWDGEHEVMWIGSWLGYLFQRQSVFDADTSCVAFSYGAVNGNYEHDSLGYWIDTTIDTTWPDPETMVIDTLIDSSRYATRITRTTRHSGTDYFRPDTAFWGNYEMDNTYVPVSGQRESAGWSILAPSSNLLISSYSCQSTFDYQQRRYWWPEVVEGGPFTLDTVLAWGYIDSLNMSLVYKRKSMIGSASGDTAVVYDSTIYDANYLPIAKLQWFDQAYHTETDTTVTVYDYDANGIVEWQASGVKSGADTLGVPSLVFSDTTEYEYDTSLHLVKIIDPDFAGASRDLKTIEYFDNGQVKKETDMYGEDVQYRYDNLGRDSAVWLPLMADSTEASMVELRETNNAWTGGSVLIDSESSLTSMSKSYYDKFYRSVRNVLQVSSSPDDYIVDSIVYSAQGLADSVMRARYSSDVTSDKVWTKFKYDELARRVKTIYPDGSADSTNYINDTTTEYLYARGNKKIDIINFEGLLIESKIYDTSGTLVGSYTYEYGQLGRLEKVTDLMNRSREYEYDDYGRPTKLIDPDVGTIQTWYNTRGQKRFTRYITETDYNYFKYDSDNRMIEFGTAPGLIYTDSVDAANYPFRYTSITATFRYDDYPNASDSAYMANGLGYCLGRLTRVDDASGRTLFYYDAQGRVGIKRVYINGLGTSKVEYEYYDNGEIKKIGYPNKDTTAYILDMAGRIEEIEHSWTCESDTTLETIVENVEYEAWGPATAWDFTAGLKSRRVYDNMSRLDQSLNYDANDNFYSRQFNYEDGFITSEWEVDTSGSDTTSTAGTIRTYEYDKRGRLVTTWMDDPIGSADSTTLTYQYDKNGNLDWKNMPSAGGEINYSGYAGTNCDSVVVFGSDSSWFFVRDARGRITSKTSYDDDSPADTSLWDRRESYSYDHRNLLTSVLSVLRVKDTTVVNYEYSSAFYYNGSGQRVKAITNRIEIRWWFHIHRWDTTSVSTSKYYVWSGGKIVYEKIGDSEPRNHVYGLGQRLASSYLDEPEGGGGQQMAPGGPPEPDPEPGGDPPPGGGDTCWTVMNYYVNDQYGSVRSSVRGGSALTRLEYYPYGETYSITGGGSVYGFLGKEDPGVGMLDFGPRYYNGVLGRFLSPDPILAGASPYSYAAGNPVMLYDPSGMWSEPNRYWEEPSEGCPELDFMMAQDQHGDWYGMDERDARWRKNWDDIRANQEWESTKTQMEETGVRVEIHVWGWYLDKNGKWAKDASTTGGHVSIRIVSTDGTIKYAYASHFPDPNSLFGISGYEQQTYDIDPKDKKALYDLGEYKSQVIIDITSGFGGNLDNIVNLTFAVNDHTDSGPYGLATNCGPKVIYDLNKGNYRGTRPFEPNLPLSWLKAYGKATDPPYPMTYRRKGDEGWYEYDPFGSY